MGKSTSFLLSSDRAWSATDTAAVGALSESSGLKQHIALSKNRLREDISEVVCMDV
jgi:hypothetical protein